MQIGTRLLNSSTPPLVVAEISCNHKQQLNLAHRLVKEAHKCGCDAVKFQTFRADTVAKRDEVSSFSWPPI